MTGFFQRAVVVTVVGWLYVAIGALILSALIGNLGPFAPPPESEEGRHLEWAPLAFPFLLLAAWVFVYAGYHALTRPPLHRRRTIWLGFLALTVLFLIWGEWRSA